MLRIANQLGGKVLTLRSEKAAVEAKKEAIEAELADVRGRLEELERKYKASEYVNSEAAGTIEKLESSARSKEKLYKDKDEFLKLRKETLLKVKEKNTELEAQVAALTEQLQQLLREQDVALRRQVLGPEQQTVVSADDLAERGQLRSPLPNMAGRARSHTATSAVSSSAAATAGNSSRPAPDATSPAVDIGQLLEACSKVEEAPALTSVTAPLADCRVAVLADFERALADLPRLLYHVFGSSDSGSAASPVDLA